MGSALGKRLAAELIGTFWLVFGGCGSAVLAGVFLSDGDGGFNLGIGFLGVSFAFGLTVLTGAYSLGRISGGHFNPAVSLGVWAAGRFPAKDLLPYIVVQLIGGVLGAGALALIINGKQGFEASGNWLAANGFGDQSPGLFNAGSAALAEVIATFMFLVVIIGATHKKASPVAGGLAIGLALTLVHLFLIPVTNASVNPARSLGPAVFVVGDYLNQVWFFFLFPILGALVAGFTYRALFEADEEEPALEGTAT